MTSHPAVTLEPARCADVHAIALMSRDLIEYGLNWRWTPARVAMHQRRADSIVLAARLGRALAGFAIMQFGDERAHLSLLAVHAGARRRGIGRRLVAWLEASAGTAGIQAVSLEVRARNGAALAFYRALGYEEIAVSPRYYDGRLAAVRMLHILHLAQPPVPVWQPPRIDA